MTLPTHSNVLDEFLAYFAVEPVETTEQLRDAGRLRHQVYCEEFNYEPVKPSGIEVDGHDGHSLHCVVRHIRSGVPAGCLRLICASENHSLALEDYCLGALHLEYMNTLGRCRERVCEFSRLAVGPAFRFRRRIGDANSDSGPLAECEDSERYCFPMVTTATFLAAFATAELAGRSDVFGMMEASLPRLLRRAGISVQPAGEFMDYHGRRAPHFITVTEAVAGMHPDVREFYDRIYTDLATASTSQASKVAVA